MLLEEMLSIAVQRAEQRQNNDKPFEVKELFGGDEWNKLMTTEKRRLGQLFARKVDTGEVKATYRTSNGTNRHNRYITKQQ